MDRSACLQVWFQNDNQDFVLSSKMEVIITVLMVHLLIQQFSALSKNIHVILYVLLFCTR